MAKFLKGIADDFNRTHANDRCSADDLLDIVKTVQNYFRS